MPFPCIGQNVANGLGDFLSSLIPLSCEDENNLKLLRELCSLSTSILAQKHGTQKVHVTMVFGFICKLLATHGDVVERGTVSGVNGHTSRGNDSDVAKLVTDALLTVVSVIEQEIPSVRDASRNGQNGVETKEPTANASSMSDESLSAILTVLNQALVSCPIVLLHLSSASEGKPNVDKLFRQVISSAVSSLSGSVPELTRSSISFLMTLVSKSHSVLPSPCRVLVVAYSFVAFSFIVM
jgi:hypothetical protein